MPQDIKLWEILDDNKLKEISRAQIDVEERLEDWLEDDISTVSNDILVIGRQVETDFGGVIDLLGIDYNGDLVIVELKRDKTPREITAQALDYASWVKDLSNERIHEVAQDYFKEENGLENNFKKKFGQEIPEILNEHHKILIVACEIDSSSERIIKYLSDSYGIGINAVTFRYFEKEAGQKFIARAFLIEPEEADYRTKTKTVSKRKPPLSFEELQEIADKQGVGELYQKAVQEIGNYFDQRVTTRSTVAFIGLMGEKKARNTLFSLSPTESASSEGLYYTVYLDRFTEYFNVDKGKILASIPRYKTLANYEEWAGEYGGGYFKSEEEIENFGGLLGELKQST